MTYFGHQYSKWEDAFDVWGDVCIEWPEYDNPPLWVSAKTVKKEAQGATYAIKSRHRPSIDGMICLRNDSNDVSLYEFSGCLWYIS